MNALTRQFTLITFGLAVLALASTAEPALARNGAGLRVASVAIQSRAIVVDVANSTAAPRRATVVARVLTTRGVAVLIASLDVPAQQSGTVRMDLPATGLDLPPLGVVVDDGAPF